MVHCRVSRSVEVPSGPRSVVYTAKEHPMRAATAATAAATAAAAATVAAAVPAYRGSGTTMEGWRTLCPMRPRDSRCYVAHCPGYCLRVDVTRLLLRHAEQVRVDSFYRDSVKMSIDAPCPVLTLRKSLRGDNGPVSRRPSAIRELAREARPGSDLRSAASPIRSSENSKTHRARG